MWMHILILYFAFTDFYWVCGFPVLVRLAILSIINVFLLVLYLIKRTTSWCNSQCSRFEYGRSWVRAQIKDFEIGICWFSAKHAPLRSKSKVWLARTLDNVWSDMSNCGLLFQWTSTIKIPLCVFVYYQADITF